MQQKFFSIIVVSLNAGERLKKTLDSIFAQSFLDYEVIIKDGESKDGSLKALQDQKYFENKPVLILQKKDNGIYDGMNQALVHASGKYIQFLNCGDSFRDEQVLQSVYDVINSHIRQLMTPHIFYGNQYNLIQNAVITSVPEISDFSCFRNVPCHQVCFYDGSLFKERAYNLKYTVRADYEHFLYCVYEKKTKTVYMPIIICNYEGGGYSETKKNRKLSAIQHKEITNRYLGTKAFFYRVLMLLTLAPLRTAVAESKTLSKYYNQIKSFMYK